MGIGSYFEKIISILSKRVKGDLLYT